MFRYVLSLTFAVGLVSAAPISATCNGVITLGMTSASCNGPGLVFAMIQTTPSFAASAGANAQATGNTTLFTSASVSGDFFFTVFGGTGQGSFYPCFLGGGNHTAMEQGFFDGISVNFNGAGNAHNCFGDGTGLFPFSKQLTFGASQIVPFQIAVSAFADPAFILVSASLSFSGILFFDASGNLLPNATYTLVSVDLPEPSPWSLLGVGLLFFVAVSILPMRCFHRANL